MDLTWDENGSGVYKYFLKLVPTFYRTRRSVFLEFVQLDEERLDEPIFCGQNISVKLAWSGSLPAVYFLYDFSPIAVTIDTEATTCGVLFDSLMCRLRWCVCVCT